VLDLHSHTTASDGVLRPSGLVRAARQAGVRTLAVTDHDTLSGLAEARRAGAELGVEILDGVEISTVDARKTSIHVLGYLFDPSSPALTEVLSRAQGGREARNLAIAARLNSLGMPIDLARVRALAEGTVGRPHFARVMVSEGYVASMEDAFDLWLGDGKPAYVPEGALTPRDAVDALRAAGGVAVLAHPLSNGRSPDHALAELRRAAKDGFDGAEVYYRSHTPGEVKMLASFAAQNGLIGTGGSDTHVLPWTHAPALPATTLERLRAKAARARTSAP